MTDLVHPEASTAPVNNASAGCPKCGAPWERIHPDRGYECNRCGFFPREQIVSPPQPLAAPRNSSGASQATRLVQLGAATTDLFHAPEGEAFAAIEALGCRQTWAIRSQGFRSWLARRFYEEEAKAPSGSAISDALTVLEGKAVYEGDSRRVWTRVAEAADGSILVDLGTDAWDAVRVRADGWEVIRVPDVHFRRASTVASLPLPRPGGSLEELRRVINLEDDRDFQRVIGWLVGALRPRPTYPVLVFVSEQGSGKSIAARCLRSLIDPSAIPLRAMPKDDRDLAIASRGNYVLAFDNISHIPGWLSDALCRIASGEGWATRRLYTDAEEEIFTFARPVLLTGIDDFIAASDLLDRTQLAGLPSIPPERRRLESELLEEFEALRPGLFGGLLDAVAMALRNRHKIWTGLPRLADYVSWVMSAEPALPWPQGAFLRSFSDSAASAHEVVLDASPIAEEIRRLAFAHEPDGWEGTSTDLLRELERLVDDTTRRGRAWPKTARALSNQVRRILPTLRAINVAVTFQREPRATRRRLIRLVPRLDPVDEVQRVDAGGVDDVDAGSPGVAANEAAPGAEGEAEMDEVDAVDDEFSSLEEWEEDI